MNPALLSPASRFAVLEHQTGRRSPSISPYRWRYSAESGLDPLLFNLSPSSTLQALEALDVPLLGHDVLPDSLATASASDRVFGIRAALAGKKLKEWHREISAWPWPNTSASNGFRPPVTTYHGREPLNVDHEGLSNGFASGASVKEHGVFDIREYCGSIPKELVQDYEDRIEAIQHDMDELDLENLKEYVRNAHMNPHLRPGGRRILGAGEVASDYKHLDEFTAVVTATIMHALPTISRLSSLLSVWSTRLAVLRHVPGFQKLLKESQREMSTEVNRYRNMELRGDGKDLERIKTTFSSKRDVLEAKIFELGRTLDAMLDLLEGKEDTVPEEWIDEMESLESDFSDWVVETERSIMEHFLKIHQRDAEDRKLSDEPHINEKESPGPAPSSHQALARDDSLAEEDAGGSIEPQHFVEVQSLPFTHADPCGSDRPVDRSQDKPSDVSNLAQDCSPSSAESLSASAVSENDMEQSSAPKGFGFQKSNLLLTPQREIRTCEQASVPKEDLSRVDDEMDNCAFERTTLSNDSTSDGASQDPFREGEIYTPPTRDATEDINTETESTVSVESKPSQIGSLESRKEVPTDEATISFSELTMTSDMPAPTTTGSFSSPVYPMTIHDSEAQLLEEIINRTEATPPRPSPLIIRPTNTNYDGNASSEISSDTSHPGSGTSEYFSNMSSPEIQHASVAEYFENPVEVTTSLKSPSTPHLSLSRQSSQRTERGESLTQNNGIAVPPVRPISHTRRAASFAPESTIYENTRPSDESRVRPDYLNSHLRVRSASLRSFEIIPRNEVRNIIISRKRDSSSDLDPHSHKGEISLPPQQLSPESTMPKDPIGDDDDDDDDDDSDRPGSPTKTKILQEAINGSSITSETLTEPPVSAQRPPGGSARSQHRFESYSDLSPGSNPAKVRQRKAAGRLGLFSSSRNAANDHPSSPLQNSGDRLEARISSILTEIPGHIRLKSGPEDDAREILPSGSSSGRKRPFLRSLATKSIKTSPASSSPALTLTPAHPKQLTPRAHEGDSEIKLYHLHQSGKDAPIKLFVRLVGEGGERVMVRIGGGWADLGEYLKEYAIHHGRRSTSDGRFEIQGMPQSPSAASSSGPAGFPSSPTSSSSRPNSSSGRPNQVSHPHPKPKRHSFGSAPADPNSAPVTPANHPKAFRSFEPVTPGSTESIVSSSYPLRPSSRLSTNTEDDSPSIGLGLAGPRSRRTVVSPTKQAWVDGMVDQARKVSGEKRKTSFKGKKADMGDFGDLGRVGSTKRVFLKMRKDGVRSGSGVTAESGSGSVFGSGTGAEAEAPS